MKRIVSLLLAGALALSLAACGGDTTSDVSETSGTNVSGIDCSCRDKNHGATHTQMADDEGRGSIRPGWEILYNHYAKVANVGSGYTYAKQFADKLRPEGGVGEPGNRYGTNSGAFDQLGWGTLMLYRE